MEKQKNASYLENNMFRNVKHICIVMKLVLHIIIEFI